jgi:hypothetical protein
LSPPIAFQWFAVDYFGFICPGYESQNNRIEVIVDNDSDPSNVVATYNEGIYIF